MNILYINHYAGSQGMGMEFRPYYLSREWIKMGHKVTVIAADYSHLRKNNPIVNKDFTSEIIDEIEYVWIKTGRYEGNGIRRAVTMGVFVEKLQYHAKGIAKKWKPDIVIASSTYPLDAFAAKRIALFAKAKYIHEVHDMWPATLYEIGGMPKYHPFVIAMQIAEDYAYRTCDDLVALAPYSKDYMVRHGLKPYKFHNIQNGIAEEEWQNTVKIPHDYELFFEKHKDKFVVGYFGGHALSNALDNILDAAKLCNSTDTIFVLVGDGIEKPRLLKRKSDENINNVFFLDSVDKRMIPDLVAHFNCSIITGMPSPLYRFGLCVNKMYDSMMAGIPVICAISAPKTLIEEYECGIQISNVTAENIAREINNLKKASIIEQREMGAKGKRAIMERFTYSKLAEEFASIFN